MQLDETTKQLHIAEGLKTSLQSETENLHRQIAEMKVEMDLKSSGEKASEAVLRDEIGYFAKRVEELETELDQKSKEFDTQYNEVKKLGNIRGEEVSKIENQLKEKIANEISLTQKIADKEKEIGQLKIDIENLTKSDSGSQEVMKTKDNEIERLSKISESLESKLKQLQTELVAKLSEISSRDEENLKLREVVENQKSEIDNKLTQIEQQSSELELKSNEIIENKNQIDARSLEIVELKFEVESLQNQIKKFNESSNQAQAAEESLSKKVTELSESKAKLESDLNEKDNEVTLAKEQIAKLQREKEEIEKCMSGLNVEAEGKVGMINEKNAIIDKLTKDLNELKERNQNDVNELQATKKKIEEQFSIFQKSSEEQIQKLHVDFEGERKKFATSIEELNAIAREKDARIDVMNKNSTLLTEKKEELEARVSEFEMKFSESMTKLIRIEKDDSEKVNLFSEFNFLLIFYFFRRRKLKSFKTFTMTPFESFRRRKLQIKSSSRIKTSLKSTTRTSIESSAHSTKKFSN